MENLWADTTRMAIRSITLGKLRRGYLGEIKKKFQKEADKLKEFNDRVAAANKQPQNDSNSKLQDVAPNFIPLPSSIPFTPAYTPTEVPTPMRVPEGALFEIPFEFFPI